MALVLSIVYVPEYADTGWFDNDGYGGPGPGPYTDGPVSWFNRDLTDLRLAPITLNIFEQAFFDDPDVIYGLHDHAGTPYHTPHGDIQLPAGITVEVTAALFDDPDKFFVPIAIRALKQSDQMLKNEVRRIR